MRNPEDARAVIAIRSSVDDGGTSDHDGGGDHGCSA